MGGPAPLSAGAVARSEAELISAQQEKVEVNYASRRKHDSSRPATVPCHPEDLRAKVESHRRRVSLLRRFPKLKEPTPISSGDASALLWTLAATADVDLEQTELPGNNRPSRQLT